MIYDPERALSDAMHVFWRLGYEATSLTELLKAMGLSKSSFYQGFGGKKELFLLCLDRYAKELCGVLQAELAVSRTGLEFIEKVLLTSAGEARRRGARYGCLLMNTASEFGQSDPEIAAHLSADFAALRRLLASAVLRGQQDGSVTGDGDAESLAKFLLSSLGGIKTMVKAGAGEAEVKAIVGCVARALR